MSQVKNQPASTQPGQTQSSASDPGQQSPPRGLSRRREDLMPTLWAESPLAVVRRFSEEMDRFFGDAFAGFGTERRGRGPRIGAA